MLVLLMIHLCDRLPHILQTSPLELESNWSIVESVPVAKVAFSPPTSSSVPEIRAGTIDYFHRFRLRSWSLTEV